MDPPKVKQQSGRAISYEYGIKMLSKDDVRWLNMVMLNTAEHYFGYCDFERIKPSIEYYNNLVMQERRYDLGFMFTH